MQKTHRGLEEILEKMTDMNNSVTFLGIVFTPKEDSRAIRIPTRKSMSSDEKSLFQGNSIQQILEESSLNNYFNSLLPAFLCS